MSNFFVGPTKLPFSVFDTRHIVRISQSLAYTAHSRPKVAIRSYLDSSGVSLCLLFIFSTFQPPLGIDFVFKNHSVRFIHLNSVSVVSVWWKNTIRLLFQLKIVHLWNNKAYWVIPRRYVFWNGLLSIFCHSFLINVLLFDLYLTRTGPLAPRISF